MWNGALRREVLKAEWFTLLEQAQTIINIWLKQYNRIWSNQVLNICPSVPETLLKTGP